MWTRYEDYLINPTSAEDWLDRAMDSNLSPDAEAVAVAAYDHAAWDQSEDRGLVMEYERVWQSIPDSTPRWFRDRLKELRSAGLYRPRGHRLLVPGPNYWPIRYAMGYVDSIPAAVTRAPYEGAEVPG